MVNSKYKNMGGLGTEMNMGVLLLGICMSAMLCNLEGSCVPHLAGLNAQALLQQRQQVQRQAALAAHVAQLHA